MAGMAGLYVLRPAGVQKVAVGRRRRRRRSYGSAHEQQLSAASVFINGYDIAAHLSLLVVVVAIMEHWIGRAGARGGIYDGSARGWRRRGRGEGTGRRGRTEGGQVSYATPPLIVLRPWQQSSSAERGEEEDEMTKPPACCRCCCALGGVGMR